MVIQNHQIKSIPENELYFTFIRGTGPGGQNKNKVATVAQLRFNLRDSPSLSPDVKERLAKLAGAKLNQNGEIIIISARYRTQKQNRRDATQRFFLLVAQASRRKKVRRVTHPSLSSRIRRLEMKKRHGLLKKQRHSVDE